MNDANEIKEVEIPASIKCRWFADIKNKDIIDRLRMTFYSLYATSLADHSEYMLEHIKRYFPDLSKVSITDGTACIGGNARMFVGRFERVNIVDMSEIHIEILKNNFKVLGLDERKDVKIVRDNYLNVATSLKQDIVFLDPPWGGIDYHSKRADQLFLLDDDDNKIMLHPFINDVLSKHTKMVILKVPKYYVLSSFDDITNFENIEVLSVMKDYTNVLYKMIIISHVKPESRNFDRKRLLSSVNYRNVLKRSKFFANKKRYNDILDCEHEKHVRQKIGDCEDNSHCCKK